MTTNEDEVTLLNYDQGASMTAENEMVQISHNDDKHSYGTSNQGGM